MKPTRGFHGRGHRDPRLPPGQYDVGRNRQLAFQRVPLQYREIDSFFSNGMVAVLRNARGGHAALS
jgi:hypothetical protein